MNPADICSAIAFPPGLSPVIVDIGFGLSIRWYGLGYVVGILFSWWYGRLLLKKNTLWPNATPPMAAIKLDDFVIWSVIAVVIGGRLGEVLFYQPAYYFSHPSKILAVTDGGMSFHGGFLAMVIAMMFFALKNRIAIWSMFDLIAAGVPVGLGLVRVANFINQELWGHPTNVAWAVCFPNDPDYLPRHPSQLYEAALEGVGLFIILTLLVFVCKGLKKPGLVAGVFVTGYGIARIFVEFFRLPSDPSYYITDWFTLGMAYSTPMLAFGCFAIIRALYKGRPSA